MPFVKPSPYRHSDKSINISHHSLRAQIIRERLDGLEQVVTMRGLYPGAMRVPIKAVVRSKSGESQRAVLEQFRTGPKTVHEIATTFAERLDHVNDWNRRTRVSKCLRLFEGRGVVVQDFGVDGCLWKLP